MLIKCAPTETQMTKLATPECDSWTLTDALDEHQQRTPRPHAGAASTFECPDSRGGHFLLLFRASIIYWRIQSHFRSPLGTKLYSQRGIGHAAVMILVFIRNRANSNYEQEATPTAPTPKSTCEAVHVGTHTLSDGVNNPFKLLPSWHVVVSLLQDDISIISIC